MQAHGLVRQLTASAQAAPGRSARRRKRARRARSAATKPSMSARSGISISTTAPSRCSLRRPVAAADRAGHSRRPLATVLPHPVVPLGDRRRPGARPLAGDPEAWPAAGALMTDNGSAMVAEEVEGSVAPGDRSRANTAVQPLSKRQARGLLGERSRGGSWMLEGVAELTLERLNEATQAWVEIEYNRAVHREFLLAGRALRPGARRASRSSPRASRCATRFAWKPSGSASKRRHDLPRGVRFEVPARYRHFREVTVRYARWDLAESIWSTSARHAPGSPFIRSTKPPTPMAGAPRSSRSGDSRRRCRPPTASRHQRAAPALETHPRKSIPPRVCPRPICPDDHPRQVPNDGEQAS
jgi:hypothetical protein